jgi:predicted phosphodiesterase
MRLRIVSDLHLNKNGDDKPTFDINDDVLTIIAGDVSKNIDETYEYIHSNFKRAIFVEGNHLLYKNDNIPIQDKYDELRKMFPIESDLTFLQNNYKIVGDYIFIGATL